MGLAERRRIATIRDQLAPRFQKELSEALGFELPFELDAGSFPEDSKVLDCWDWYFESYGPPMVVTVMKAICADALGRDAVAAKFDKIVFRNAAKSEAEPGDKSVAIDDRTLTVAESFYGYSDKLFGEADLQKAIETLL
jgi:hypothetical protein